MHKDELQGDLNELIIGSKEEKVAARQRITAEFDRLTGERDSLIQDKGNLMVDLGKEMQRSSRAEEALDRICEPIKLGEMDAVRSVLRRGHHSNVIYACGVRVYDYLDSQQQPDVCPKCKTEPMIWYEPWNRHICRSWWCMEGGCKTWDNAEKPKIDPFCPGCDMGCCATFHTCKPKDEEVLREILVKHFGHIFVRGQSVTDILEQFQLKEGE